MLTFSSKQDLERVQITTSILAPNMMQISTLSLADIFYLGVPWMASQVLEISTCFYTYICIAVQNKNLKKDSDQLTDYFGACLSKLKLFL